MDATTGRSDREPPGDPPLRRAPPKAPRKEGVGRTKGLVGGVGLGFALVLGVIAPFAAVVVELTTGICAETFFDPLPTPVHTFLFLLLATVNAFLWHRATTRQEVSRRLAGPLWGAAMGVAVWYSIAFSVIAPLSFIAIMFFGMGFLSLSPMSALMTTWTFRAKPASARPRAWLGACVALVALCVADLPAAASHVALIRAASADPAKSRAALGFLRAVVPDDAILRAASKPPSTMSPVGAITRLGWSWNRNDARETAWRATGRVPRLAEQRGAFGLEFAGDDAWMQLGEQGGSMVGALVDDLCMSASRLEGDVDTAARVADLTWTMSFRNDDQWLDAEARASIALPPGAVVSDATLWVDGEPRPAVFASRQKAREAYENIVKVERRDPLLVSLEAPDRVLVQCFPVLSKGGAMQIRVRLAIPLRHDGAQGLTLHLPRFDARNFSVCGGTLHDLHLRSNETPSAAPSVLLISPRDGHVEIAGAFDDTDIAVDDGGQIEFRRGAARPFCVADAQRPGFIRGEWRPERATPPDPLIVVVDASGSTATERTLVSDVLADVPDGARIAVIVASDEVVDATGGVVALQPDVRERVRQSTETLAWAGGVDAIPALQRAERLLGTSGGAILWLRGAQPLIPARSAEQITGPFGESPTPIRAPVVGLRVGRGPNAVAANSEILPGYRAALWSGDPQTALQHTLREWYRDVPIDAPTFAEVERPEQSGLTVSSAAEHPINALRGAAAVTRLLHDPRDVASDNDEGSRRSAACQVAVDHRIVTECSSAVVLETKAQYVAAGLEPPGVATVPEPAEWAIIALIVAALAVAFVRRRRALTGSIGGAA